MLSLVCLLIILTAGSLWAADAPVTAAPSGVSQRHPLTEINKKLTNPVSDLWSIAFSRTITFLDMGPGKIFLTWWLEYRYSGNVLANWKADKAGDVWTVPSA